MDIQWVITEDDIYRVKQFVKENKSRDYVKDRIKNNVEFPPPIINRDIIWEVQFDCLLTTQQRSGSDSQVARLMHEKPFPLSYSVCSEQTNIADFVTRTLYKFGGIRFCNKIGWYAGYNYKRFSNGGWDKFEEKISPLVEQRKRIPIIDDQRIERKVSETLRVSLMGIGTKQARNYLQLLGLTRYEIPIDSRFLSWFKEFEVPITIKQNALSSPKIYNAVQDKIQELCIDAEILPCILDACVFARKDDY